MGNRPKSVIITQARLRSTRLPGKVMLTVAGKTLLEHHLERLRRTPEIDEVVVATTTDPADDPLVHLCHTLQAPVHRGSEEDVLSRYAGAAKAHAADIVIRVTSDCPLIDPEIIHKTWLLFRHAEPAYDYVSNIQHRTYPRGMDAEVFSYDLLNLMNREAKNSAEREHVTPYVIRRPERFRLGSVTQDRDESAHRWTVDTPDDFQLIQRILETLYPANPRYTLADALALLAQHPEWSKLNHHIQQKAIGGHV